MQTNKIITIVWTRWKGKTALSTFLARLLYNEEDIEIYSNFPLKMWSKQSILIEKPKLSVFKNSNKKKLIILDELWVVGNSKDWQNKSNKWLGKFFFLSRKIDADIILIAQDNYSILKDWRWQSDYIILIKNHWLTQKLEFYKKIQTIEAFYYYHYKNKTFNLYKVIQNYFKTGLIRYDTNNVNFEIEE